MRRGVEPFYAEVGGKKEKGGSQGQGFNQVFLDWWVMGW